MNTITPHNVRPVDTTVGELEPGTLFQQSGILGHWLIRNRHGSDAVATYLGDATQWFELDHAKIFKVADSVTIGPKI